MELGEGEWCCRNLIPSPLEVHSRARAHATRAHVLGLMCFPAPFSWPVCCAGFSLFVCPLVECSPALLLCPAMLPCPAPCFVLLCCPALPPCSHSLCWSALAVGNGALGFPAAGCFGVGTCIFVSGAGFRFCEGREEGGCREGGGLRTLSV